MGVLRLGGWSPHVQTGFLVSRPTHGHKFALPVRGCHPLRPDFPDGSGTLLHDTGLVPFRSPLLRESRLMSFPPVTEMFQFTGFAPTPYIFRCRYPKRGGFPHSEIHGSKLTGSSPRLIAACHVLHRLHAPRHPPDALRSLEISPISRKQNSRIQKTQHPISCTSQNHKDPAMRRHCMCHVIYNVKDHPQSWGIQCPAQPGQPV